MYVKITNGSVDTYPYSVGQLRRDNPNTSFPKRVTEELLNSYGVYPVTVQREPDHDRKTHKVSLADTPSLVDGVWTIVATLESLTTEEVEHYNTVMSSANRTRRDTELAQTDWWASSDLTMTAEQTAYRQALRDITTHANWPHLEEADWPTKP